MAAYNTGASNTATFTPNSSGHPTVTIPAGVLVNDVMIFSVDAFTFQGGSPSFSTPTSGGTGTWQQIGTIATSTTGGSGLVVYSTLWWKVATSGDPGSTLAITYTGTAGTTDEVFWDIDVEAYTGFYTTSPIGAVAQSTGGSATTLATATALTTAANSWAVYACPSAGGGSGSISSGPAGSTNRRLTNPGNGVDNAVNDSNGSVGAAGTTIGGGNFTFSSSPNWAVAFTVELLTQAPTPPATPSPPTQQSIRASHYPTRRQRQQPAPPPSSVSANVAGVAATVTAAGGVGSPSGSASTTGVGAQVSVVAGNSQETDTLFGQPTVADSIAADVTSYTLGVQFEATQSGTLKAIWFYSAAGAGQLPDTIALFAVSGQSLVHSESASWSGAAGTGWVRAAFSSPPSLTANTMYKAAVLLASATGNWYTATHNYWVSPGAGQSGITSGNLFAPNNAGGDGGQGTFNATGTLTYPASSFQSSNYWVDPEVSSGSGSAHVSGGANVTGVGAQVTVAAGTGTLSAGVSIAGAGAQVTVAGGVGTPSGSANVAGVGAQVTVAGGVGTPSGAGKVTGVGASVTVAGGVGTPGGAGGVTGVGAQVTVGAGTGTLSAGVSIAGVGAQVVVSGGIGSANAGGSFNVSGMAAAVTVAGGVGSVSAGSNVSGVGAQAVVAGGIGTPHGSANIAGVGAQVLVGAGIGSPAAGGSANVSGVGALVTTAAGIGQLAASANIAGVAALVALAGGVGTPRGSANVPGAGAQIVTAGGAGFAAGGTITLLTVGRACAFQARLLVTSQAAAAFNAGQPVQAGLVTMASDSWVAMSPDTM